MKKKILSVMMAAAMVMSVSLTAFAQTPKLIQASGDTAAEKTQTESEKKTVRKVITKNSSKEKSVKAATESTVEKTAETKEKTAKTSSKLSAYNDNIRLSYGSFDYPQNAVAEKVDNRAYDITLGDLESEDGIIVRLRAFDHSTSLNEEIVDENGMMYAMYTGFLTVVSLNKSAAEISKGLDSQQVRREVAALFNQVLTAEDGGKTASYTKNKEMGAIQILYLDEETAENCTILHGRDYDYVLYGVSSSKNQATLNKLENLIASSLKEKTKL